MKRRRPRPVGPREKIFVLPTREEFFRALKLSGLATLLCLA